MQQAASRESADAGFARKSYIDGVAYMLQALPDDLDDHERAVIRQALPEACVPRDPGQGYVMPPGQRAIGWHSDGPGRKRPLLHRTVAVLVSGLVLAIHVLASLAIAAIRVGAQYERQYNITQQLMARGLVVATAVGRHSVVISAKIYSLGDGRVGKAVADFASWWVESVTAGIQDGIGLGLYMIEQKRQEANVKNAMM